MGGVKWRKVGRHDLYEALSVNGDCATVMGADGDAGFRWLIVDDGNHALFQGGSDTREDAMKSAEEALDALAHH